jgi:hypothetical protein
VGDRNLGRPTNPRGLERAVPHVGSDPLRGGRDDFGSAQ